MCMKPEIMALVGQEASFRAVEPVDAGKIRRFALALGLEDPRYYDLAADRPTAPLTFVFSVNHDSLVGVDESGRPTNRLSLPPPFGPAIRGGNKFQFFRPVQVGDLISIHRKITDLKEKQGRRGPLAFLTYDLKYTSQQGDLLGINTETLIFQIIRDKREGKGPDPEKEAPRKAPPQSSGMEEIPPFLMTVSKVRMMMYAAATWNPYQLHWDSDYARRHGFPDANVAGPMFADYLVEMLARWAGHPSRVVGLEYANRAMAFPGDTLVCKGKIKGRRREGHWNWHDCLVWAENQKGDLLAEGTAAVSLSLGP
jgi:hydroxyacyl-ACP dehydratase HTD2-like protein with hotdog domain